MRVLVVSGGRSAEREISIQSAMWVSEELKAAGHEVLAVNISRKGSWTPADSPGSDGLRFETGCFPWKIVSDGEELLFDVVFPVLHGVYGEDGTVQGLCATAGWPCAGTPVMGSAVAMEKHTLKNLASKAGIPVVPWVFLHEGTQASDEAVKRKIAVLGFPLFVKPSRLGSSVGVGKADNPEELAEAIREASGYDSMILVEKAVDSPREIEVSVLGNGVEILSSLPGEVLPEREWYDYMAKYVSGDSKLAIPADLSASLQENIRMMAEKAFRILGGRGFARVDFFVNENGVWLNEINTIPGFTSISMFPKLWAATGMNSEKLLNFILDEAVSRVEYGLKKDNDEM